MRFAEVFLRLGTALVAWMLLFAHFLWVAVVRVTACGPDGHELHVLLLATVPAACVSAWLIRVSRPLEGVHPILLWLGAPLGLFIVLALGGIWSVASTVHIKGESICQGLSPALWEQFWSPVQLATAILVACVIAIEIKRSY
jgi:NADH:ubiquinone oxidoreductase subunit 6 (subunit J)